MVLRSAGSVSGRHRLGCAVAPRLHCIPGRYARFTPQRLLSSPRRERTGIPVAAIRASRLFALPPPKDWTCPRCETRRCRRGRSTCVLSGSSAGIDGGGTRVEARSAGIPNSEEWCARLGTISADLACVPLPPAPSGLSSLGVSASTLSRACVFSSLASRVGRISASLSGE